MNLTRLSLKNFKCFADFSSGLAKITLITGANSSGKSSILYSLLSVLQSQSFPQDWELNGELISLGDFREVVHNHNASKTIEIGLSLKNESITTDITAEFGISHLSKQAELIRYTAKNEYLNATFSNDQQLTLNVSYDPTKDPESKHLTGEIFQKVSQFLSSITRTDAKTGKQEKLVTASLQDFTTPKEFKIEAKTLKEFRSKLNSNFTLMLKAKEFGNISETLAGSFNFVGPFRHSPDRTYYRRARRDIKVGGFGENYIEQLLQWHEGDREKFSAIEKSLRQIGLGKVLSFRKMQGGRFEVRVKTKRGAPSANLVDIGLGVSQFLPLLVADYQLKNGATMMAAQPEIHLHPSAQALYGDFVVDRCKNAGRKYIIETHSEYLINRLRLLIAKGSLEEGDVKIIHLCSESDRSVSHDIKLLKNGRIENAPADFFETYQMDVLDLALTAAS